MNYKYFITIFILLPLFAVATDELDHSQKQGISFPLSTESRPQSSKMESEASRPKYLRQQARVNLKRLREGTLLVRLKTDENKIAAFIKKGKKEQAEQTERIRRDLNLRIVDAFNKHYTFSKVVFFYSSDSKKVTEQQFGGIFLNNKLERDPDISVDTNKGYYIGEIDVLEADTAKHADMPYWDPNTKKIEHTYYGSQSDYSRSALVIRDKHFIQLRRPFPYYVACESEKASDPLVKAVNTSIKPSVYKAVEKWNKKLHKKYRKYFE